MKSVNYIVVTS